MDAYSRYPNRAKPTAEPQRPGYTFDNSNAEGPSDKFAGAESKEPEDGTTEEIELHYSGYKVIDPLPESSPIPLIEVEPEISSRAAEKIKKKKAAAKAPALKPLTPELPVFKPHIPEPPMPEARISEPPLSWPVEPDAHVESAPKLPRKPTMVYVTAVAVFGVLLGLAIAYWFIGNEGQYDLGAYTSSDTGLKGHLSTKWEKKPLYRLTIEPSDKSRQEGFALAAEGSPVPLSIEIHLQDEHGAVLCSKEVILKYNAEEATAPPTSNSNSDAGDADQGDDASDQAAQRLDRARYEANEPERELDKDIFQNQIAKNGQLVSMHAEGEIPCSKKAYGNIFGWSFSSNFPAITEQDELQKLQDELKEKDARLTAEELATRKARAARSATRLLPYSMEGDDSIVEFDANHGVIETRGGKTFYFDKASGQGTDPKWEDYPVSIHYRCDRTTSCILTQARLGALRARTSR
ncbi:MAG: hypothetical protein WAK26_06070 [Terracidiphilus sp.]